MHQPDILMKVKECLSVSCESSFTDFTLIFTRRCQQIAENFAVESVVVTTIIQI